MSYCIPPELIKKIKEDALKGKIDVEAIQKMLPEERAELRSILEDYVAEKLGVKVKDKEIAEIKVRAEKIEVAQKKLGDDLGNPLKIEDNIEFFKAKKEMDDYLKSTTPSNRFKVLTGTVGRGMMLFSAKSPILNIGSNVEIGFTEALARRLSGSGLRGANNSLAVDFVKMANRVYQETGYDISRMTTLSDNGVGGERVLGDRVQSQGPGAIRKTGRVIEDIVFKQLMGAPDVAFGSAHFADSVNLNALTMAKGNKSVATEMMRDAMRLEPRTVEGEMLRNQAILDAQKATWTDTSWASRTSNAIRKILNDVSGDVRAGDYLLPFIKTPANVIATGMDYAGVGIPKAIFKTFKAVKTGQLGSRETMQSIARDLVRSGMGLTGAVIITSQLSNEDFVGAYDPQRQQIEQLRNSNYNAIRIGGKWISVDWLGPLSVSVSGIMYARKYGSTGGERTFQYTKGVASSAAGIPGIADIYDTAKSYAYQKNQSLEDMAKETQDYITKELYSRLVPSIISDLTKALDPTVRQTGSGFESVKSRIPFVSKTLPAKRNIFGAEVQGESPVTDVLFGARVKTDRETPLIQEIERVSDETGSGITFTDWSKSSSKSLAQFKAKVGEEKFNQAKIKYGIELEKQLKATIANPIYKKLTDEEKLKVLREKDTDAMNKTFLQYGFKYKAEKTAPKIKGL